MPDKLELTFVEVHRLITQLARFVTPEDVLYGIPRGGVGVAMMLSQQIGGDREAVGLRLSELHDHKVTVLVDDVVDSGRTLIRELNERQQHVAGPIKLVLALTSKLTPEEFEQRCRSAGIANPPRLVVGQMVDPSFWIVFPWELNEAPAEDGVRRILQAIGEDPDREGLRDTPARFLKAMKELVSGLASDPKEHLRVKFGDADAKGQIVALRGIEFSSLCEHHLLSFTGTVDVAYIPGDVVVGLSKLARMTLGYASRLQVQERLTSQVHKALLGIEGCSAAYVRVQAKHSCMCTRGVKAPGGVMMTELCGGAEADRLLQAVRGML